MDTPHTPAVNKNPQDAATPPAVETTPSIGRENAGPGGAPKTTEQLAGHPVEKEKGELRRGAEGYLDKVEPKVKTATQQKAIDDQRQALEREAAASPEPARGAHQSVGTERKYGLPQVD
jgi:hypothetical protein